MILKPIVSMYVQGFIFDKEDRSMETFSYDVTDLQCSEKRKELTQILEEYELDVMNLSETDRENLQNLLRS